MTTPLHTPQSCSIDGVQLGSGCTVGKRNLAVTEGERPGGVFRAKGGKAVRIELRPGLPEKIAKWIETRGVEKTAHIASRPCFETYPPLPQPAMRSYFNGARPPPARERSRRTHAS